MANIYSDSKVCLIAHAYDREAGGEYHRLSEVAPFGCIFVMEQISDIVGVDKYQLFLLTLITYSQQAKRW